MEIGLLVIFMSVGGNCVCMDCSTLFFDYSNCVGKDKLFMEYAYNMNHFLLLRDFTSFKQIINTRIIST